MDRERIFSATDAIGFGWAETKQRFTSLFFGLGVLTLMLGALEGSAQRHGRAPRARSGHRGGRGA